MYYSFPCTYCHRLFYTYDSNKHRAALTLYRTIKQHLIDYDEDKKEYELDDGEHMDTNQIYAEMKASHHQPAGAYHATKTSKVVHLLEKEGTPPLHADHHSSFNSQFALLLFLFILLLGVISLFFFFPDMFTLERSQLGF